MRIVSFKTLWVGVTATLTTEFVQIGLPQCAHGVMIHKGERLGAKINTDPECLVFVLVHAVVCELVSWTRKHLKQV